MIEHLQKIITRIGWSFKIYSSGTNQNLEMLSIYPAKEDLANIDEVTFLLMPFGESPDHCELLQVYFQFPFLINKENLELYWFICEVNKFLPLGHFNIAQNEDVIYYKAVFPFDSYFTVDQLVDTTNLILWASDEYQDRFAAYQI